MIGEIYGRPDLFPWVFAGIGLVMSVCTLINSRLSIKVGAWKAMRMLIILYTGVATLLLVLTLVFGDPPPIVILFVAIMLLLSINIAIEPNSSSLALQPMGDMAGMASAVYGTIFFFAGSAIGAVISARMVNHVFPLVLGFFILSIVATVLVFSDKRDPRRQTELQQ